MKQRNSSRYIRVLRYGIGAILVVAPFYLTISIWAYQFIKHLDLLKIWEEVALTLVALIIISFLVTRRALASRLLKNRLSILLLLYSILIVGIGAYDFISGRVGHNAIIYGWLTDLRPIAIFLLALLTFAISQAEGFKRFPWRKILLVPAILVISFGFLQATVLPDNFLSHFGYSQNTTAPYETVDNQPNMVRVQSTLRGPNPFGAYIMIVLIFMAGWLVVEKRAKHRLLILGFSLVSLYVLYKTYSRSAELGLFVSLAFLLWIKVDKRYLKRRLTAIAAVAVAAGVIIILAVAHNSYLADNILFHSSNRSPSALSSNAQRSEAEKQGLKDIIHHPLGTGVGSAGPASRRNTKGPARIAENYYLQIGQELGIEGLVLFTAITILIGYELWRRRSGELPSSILAALIGVTIASMFYHTWTDETLAYVWWGLAGIALAPVIASAARQPASGKARTR